ncbi:MAG TPA: envelope stress response membrane protein PspC, partial [Stellaceae bacterium]|nr:envelope stress response membrane protein PspC [Stellaceae bacterium]
RAPERGLIAGVCAGFADYLGFEPVLLRVATVVGAFFFPALTIIAYVALALLLKPRPPILFQSRDEERFWRAIAVAPDDTLTGLKRKFRDLEDRLGHMETQVTATDFDLKRQFKDLGER